MRLKPLIAILFFSQFFSAFICQPPVSDTYGIGKSPRPADFCTNQTMIDIPLLTTTLIYKGTSDFDKTTGALNSLYLARSGVPLEQNYVYVKDRNDWQNGFVTTFNMMIDNPTCYKFDETVCKLQIGFCWWRATESVESRCGADGFALILRYSQIDGPGLIGGGLGYKGIYSALAIEFDTFTNTDQHDPDYEGERHISVIIRKGENYGDEYDRIAWNYRPLNFKSDRFEGYLRNPSYKIQYLNRNLRVYINNILQLEYYDQLDAQSTLGMPTAFSYLGITASTGALTNDNLLSNWVLKKVVSTSSSFLVNLDPLTPKTITAGDYIYVNIFMFDSCNNRYVPYFDDPNVDSENFVSMLKFDNGCSLMSVKKGDKYHFFETGPAFQAVVSCLLMGNKTIAMTYKTQQIGSPIQVTISAGSLWAINVSFPFGQTGSVDQPFTFSVFPMDKGQNLAQTDEVTLRNKLNIFWTNNPADTVTKYNVSLQNNGSLFFSLNAQLSGQYAIQSRIMFFSAGQQEFFTIQTGAPDSSRSNGTVYSIDYQSLLGQTTLAAGYQAVLVVRLFDKCGNPIVNSNSLLHDFINEAGLEKEINQTINYNNSKSTFDVTFVFRVKGTNKLVPKYNGVALNCPICQFTVSSSTSNFSFAELWVPNDAATIKYAPNSGNNYTIVKPQLMSYLLVLKDNWGNQLDEADPSKYTATLSGNNMKTITLNLTAYSIGAQLTVPQESQAYFQNLVGRSGYIINITETGSGKSRTWNLTLVSDGSDSDADNGDYNYLITSYYWIVSPVNNLYAIAGVRYKLAVQLNTFSGKRYNSWIDESKLNFSISPFYTEKQETIYAFQRGSKAGIYTVEFMITVGGGLLRIGSIKVDSKKTAKAPIFKSYAADPSNLTIEDTYLQKALEMKNATVLIPYTFLCNLTDNFKNLVNVGKPSDLNIVINNDQANYVPVCTSTATGKYSCSFTPQAYGIATVNSPYFAQPYKLMMNHGTPSALTSNASIDDDVSSPLTAGVSVHFRITPKDSSGGILLPAETQNVLSNFSLSLINPDGSLDKIDVLQASINAKGEITTTTQVTLIGSYSFVPLLNGNQIACEICAFSLTYSDVDVTKTKILMLVGQDRVEKDPNQVLQIDNTRIVPIFYMQFYDKFLNQRPVDSNLKDFAANLAVTRSTSVTYGFTASQQRGDYRFEILDPTATFALELANDLCYLLFTAKANSTASSAQDLSINFTKVILAGSSNDSSYTNDLPDKNAVKIIPNLLDFTAGEYQTLTVELRAANGKLYKDTANKGWYADSDLQNAFKLDIQSSNIKNLSVLKGKIYGTYTLIFTSTIANYKGDNLTVGYLNSSEQTYTTAVQTVNMTVWPAEFTFLVPGDSADVRKQPCRSSNNKILTFYSYDKFSNVIKEVQTGALGFKLKNTALVDVINPVVSYDLQSGLITLSTLCKKAGNVTATAKLIQDANGTKIDSIVYTIVPGVPNPSHSSAYLTKSKINAGEIVQWVISPNDVNDNSINLLANYTDYATVLFNSTNDGSYLTENGTVSSDGLSLIWNVNLTASGKHLFKAFYQNQPISTTLNQITVLPLAAYFMSSVLAKFNSKTGLYEEYQSEFQQDISEYPIFKFDYYDVYKNALPSGNYWNLQVYISGSNVSYEYRVEFCNDSNYFLQICGNNSADQSSLEYNPKQRFNQLVANLYYNITVSNKDTGGSQLYTILLKGISDNSTKNLPYDPENTIITPQVPLVTTAGESTRFTIELRTTQPNFRRNYWFTDPMTSFKLNFKYNQSTISYNITKADITDRYYVDIRANETHSTSDPNIITVQIENSNFTKYKPKWIVNPAAIVAVFPVNFDNGQVSVADNIPQDKTVDELYTAYFLSKDKFGNIFPLVEGSLNVFVKNCSFTKEFISNGVLKVFFQPQSPGQYNISFGSDISSQYSTNILQGGVSLDTTYANLKVDWKDITSSLTAGTVVQVQIYPKDQWGNNLSLTNDTIQSFNYYFSPPGLGSDFIVGENKSIINTDNVTLYFPVTVTKKGNYNFKVISSQKLVRMITSVVNVIPARADLNSSILKYLDDEANQYLEMDKKVALKEDNTQENQIPQYLLILADIYGNLYDEFTEKPSEFNVTLNGSDYDKKNLQYDSNAIVGNALSIKINNDSLQSYHDGPANVYNFNIVWNRTSGVEKVVYPIQFLGQNGSNDSEINNETDASKTWISKTSLFLEAGSVDQYLIEVRTINGKRKADFHDKILFNFTYQNSSTVTQGNFTATVENAALKGRFLVTVSGYLANSKGLPFVVTMYLGSIATNLKVPQSLNLTVTPSKLDHIDLQDSSTLDVAGSTDIDFPFSIIPYDKYSNVADVEERDINLRIIFPSSDNSSILSSYSAYKEANTGYISYSVKCRVTGEYQLQSSLFQTDKSPSFTVDPGQPSSLTSKAEVSPNSGSMKAGTQVIINLVVMDSYYNKISAGKKTSWDQKLLSVTSVALALGEYHSSLNLVIDTPNSNLQGSVNWTQAGVLTLTPMVSGLTIQCTGCVINVSPGDLDIKSSKFFTFESDQTETKIVKSAYGSSDVRFWAELYDSYGNKMQGLDPNAIFKMTLSGNNMVEMSLNVTSNNVSSLGFSILSTDNDAFSRLVPRDNYSLVLSYTLDNFTDSTSLLLNIFGNDDGSGNGPYIPNNIFISPQSIIISAGNNGKVTIVLRQAEKLRYNGIFDPSNFEVIEDSMPNNKYVYDSLNYTFYHGQRNGEFYLDILGTQAFNGSDTKKFRIEINGTVVNVLVEVIIIPDSPVIEKTEILNPSKDQVEYPIMSKSKYNIIFRLRDKYGNLFSRSDLAPKLAATITSSGTATFDATYLNDTSGNNSYVIPFTPSYPPRLLYIMVYYNLNENSSFPIYNFPFIYSVDTVMDPNKTEVVGTNLSGVAIGKDFSFTILVKDTEGYCYEQSKSVSFRLIGPFATTDMTNNTLAFGSSTLFNQTFTTTVASPNNNASSSNGYICRRFYEAAVTGNIVQKIGWYQIEVIISGTNNDQPVLVVRKSYMLAGPAYAANSLIAVPVLYGRGSNPLGLIVKTPIRVHVFLRDAYKNLINDTVAIGNGTEYLNFNITGLTYGKDFLSTVTALSSNATFIVDVTIMRTGVLGDIFLSVLGSVGMNIQELDKLDYPQSIEILAGPCSVNYPQISYISQAVAGVKHQINIQCRDEFNNTVTKGGASFVLQINGQVEGIGVDVVNANVKDLENGQYKVDFIPTYAAPYTVLIFLNNEQYTSKFNITVINSVCPSGQYECLGTNPPVNCSADLYYDCKYDLLTGCEDDSNGPFKCKADGKCVAHRYLCPCDSEDQSKCDGDQKCVDALLIYDLCALVVDTNSCNGDYSFMCPDGSCRVSESECPSYPGCPPGTKMCADQSCVEESKTCPVFAACQNGFKCEDQSCVNDLNACPTRITCNTPGYIICPDKTCAQDENHCNLPTTCPTDSNDKLLYRCPDQSCRNSQDDCTKPITCPFGMALCEDGSCRSQCPHTATSRRLLTTYASSKLFRLLANSTTSVSQTTNAVCPDKTCPGGECVNNYYKCPNVQACPTGTVACPDLSCATSQSQCLVQVCAEGKVHCWDGSCVTNKSSCPTRSTCPNEYPVKCHDGSCVSSLAECSEYIPCPAHSPYKCANGECRAKSDECPTMITCPTKKPVLCPDNTCQKSKDSCLDAAIKTRCPAGKIRCSDSSCAYSKNLCPTVQSCPPGQIRCWDNSCAASLDACPSIEVYSDVCPTSASLRCPDGSCRADLDDCPTQIICPLDRPVKCDDGTCKQSNTLCANNTECGNGYKRCPDGSCVGTQKKCGTPITCSEAAPFLCYDNTCKIDPRDCPTMPTCTSGTAKILCPEGTCVSQRYLCKGFEVCESDQDNKDKPVKCPDLYCYASRKNCTAVTGCPGDRYLCDDGSCAESSNNCPELKCPVHLPSKCPDGFCVSDLKYCDNNVTGCPYSLPFKCKDGSCAETESKCPNNNTATCPSSEVLCPDGSCAKSLERCPLASGCSVETPLKCGNGLCINPNKTSCSVLNCPSENPIKCLNGICAKSITYCNSFIPIEDYSQCANDLNGNNVPCADGRCVASADLCRPLIPCDSNDIRCQDNSCRTLEALCPLANTCPSSKPYRCDSGACATDSNSCPLENGCPSNMRVKCKISGTCVAKDEDCQAAYNKTILKNNCTIDKPFLLANNTCSNISSSTTEEKNCSATNQTLCFDGTCVASLDECKEKLKNCTASGKYLCTDYKCVDSADKCLNKDGCPASTPFKCVNGSCVSNPFSLYGDQAKNCLPSVVCPKYKPYLCGDGECQGYPTLCRTQLSCPSETPYRCPDQSCAATREACLQAKNICPQTSPFMCQDGSCVSQSIQCQKSESLYCTEEAPFPCSNGTCVAYPFQCVSKNVRDGSIVKARLLADSNATVNTSVDPGCTNDNPHRCYDGTCRSDVLDCPLSNGCIDLASPFKCLSGACVSRAQDCTAIDALLGSCTNGTTLCEDGYCRFSCPEYNGCPNEKPLLCPNGYCARSLSECAGDSACPYLNRPYRCVDNTCVSHSSLCTTPKRNYQSEFVHITVSPVSSTTIDFIQAGENSAIRLGQLVIPAGSILSSVSTENTNSQNSSNSTNSTAELYSFVITSVPQSQVRNATNPIANAKANYTNYLFPYSDGLLEFHQTVRSPLVKLQTLNRGDAGYRFPMVLYLSSDILQGSNKSEDYCLGTLDGDMNQWKCHSRELVSSDEKMGFKVYQDGVYSVIFNPTPPGEQGKGETCGFFCEYKMTIIYVLLGLAAFSVFFTFAVWRISRYVTKYKEAKKQMKNYREQISELEQAQTDVQGQTIKDKIEGISFTTNPAFKEKSSSDMSEKISQLEKSLESSQRRNALLEKANKELDERNYILNEEYETLMKELGEKKNEF